VISGSGTLALEERRVLARRATRSRISCAVKQIGPRCWTRWLQIWCCKKNGARASTSPQGKKSPSARPDGQVTCPYGTTRGRQLLCDLLLIAVGIEPALDYLPQRRLPRARRARRWAHADQRPPMSTRRASHRNGRAAQRGCVSSGSGIRHSQAAWRVHMPERCLLPRQRSARPFITLLSHGPPFRLPWPDTRPPALLTELVAGPQPRNYRKVILQNGVAVGALLWASAGRLWPSNAPSITGSTSGRGPPPLLRAVRPGAWLSEQSAPAPLLTPERAEIATLCRDGLEAQGENCPAHHRAGAARARQRAHPGAGCPDEAPLETSPAARTRYRLGTRRPATISCSGIARLRATMPKSSPPPRLFLFATSPAASGSM